MKTTKKLFSLLLAVMMIMALGVTAFAASNDGKIIISNPQSGATYTAYKVFDVTYDGDNYSYIASEAVKTLLESKVDGLTFEKNTSGTYTVTQSGNFSPATLAKYIKDNLADFRAAFEPGTNFEADGSTAVADNLARGYYFVTSSAGSVCELTTAKTVIIKDKNEKPVIQKTVDDTDQSVEVGQKLNYTIKGKVPSTVGYTEYTYEVSDTMTAGLTYGKDVKVVINGQDVTANVIVVPKNNGFTVNINMTEYKNDVDKDVIITYSATVNDSAIERNVETNSATLKYSNDPTDSTKTDTDTTKVDVYTFNVVVDKYKSGDDATKLSGAKFVLKNSNGKFYKYDATAKTVSWVDTQNEATEVKTDNNGAASFNGIQAGTYQLEETAAPEGFNPLTKDVEIVITDKDNVTVDGSASNPAANNLSVTASVANSTGTVLPETGGIGTMIFIIVGAIAVIGAGIFLVTNKRMSKESI